MRNADAEESAREFNGGGCWGADGNNFDADMYLERLMTERSLRDLTKKNESMDKGAWHARTHDRRGVDHAHWDGVDTLAEVRELDSDMKTLVYDNYNKFISATDTIRTVRTPFLPPPPRHPTSRPRPPRPRRPRRPRRPTSRSA